MFQEIFGYQDNPLIATTLNNISIFLTQKGQYEEALDYAN